MQTILDAVGFELSLPVVFMAAVVLCAFTIGRGSRRPAKAADAGKPAEAVADQPDMLEDAFAEEIQRQRREIAALRNELTRSKTEADRLRRRGSNRAPSRVRVI